MDTRKSLIVASLALLIILGIVFGTIFYFVRVFQTRQKVDNGVGTTQSDFIFASPSPTGTNSYSTATSSGNLTNVNLYNGQTFQLKYPKGWGLLSCNNSQNFELDPVNSQDMKNTACDTAVKPITVLMGTNAICSGDTVTLGNTQVIKSKVTSDGTTSYRWCTKTTPTLEITHRVSASGQATSKDDYSSQIEQMISSLTFVRGS